MDPHDRHANRSSTGGAQRPAEASPEDTASSGIGDAAPTASFTPRPAAPRLRRAIPLEDDAAGSNRLGRFVLKARLGEGAFGRVYHAHDPQLDRDVALKVAHPHRVADEDDRQRFFREGRAAAQLEHPNIVRVYEVGTHGEHAYIVSALIKGESLDKLLAREKRSVVRAVRLVVQLCGGLHHAHLRGVFHRDIKPANILIDEAGVPHLADFGVARRSQGEELRTMEGAVVGTPAYMSPEQARGESHKVDARSDLYAVGVVLYEMLAGRRPFRGDAVEILRQLRGDDAPRLRKFNARVRADLEAVCMKALAREPQRRYPSVQHFADDLTRWLENRPVLARRIGPATRARKWVRRHPLAAGLGAALLAAVVGVGAYVQTRPAYLDVRVVPSAGARATLDGVPFVLDADGHALVDARPGAAVLHVESEGYETHEQPVQLVRGRANAALATVELRSRYGFITVVSDPQGARVELLDAGGGLAAEGTTPFRGGPVVAGRYTLRLSQDLHEPAERTVVVLNGERMLTVDEVKLAPRLQGASSYQRMKETQRILAEPTEFDFAETPLQGALDQLWKKHGLPILIDLTEVEARGISPDRPVTAALRGVSLATALRQILQPLDLTFVPDHDVAGNFLLRVTSADAAEERLLTIVYSVRELGLLGAAANFTGIENSITTQIWPQSWNDVGGSGQIIRNEAVGTLTITQSWQAHLMIDAYLRDLRLEGLAARNAPEFPAANRGAESASYAAFKQLRALVDRPCGDAEFRETPLDEVVRALAAASGVSMDIDESALEEAGMPIEMPITLARQEALAAALDALLHPQELEWLPAADSAGGLFITITTAERTAFRLHTIVYTVGDLVGGGQPDYKPLLDAIEAEIEPSYWDHVGGPGSVRSNRDQRAISVSCPWHTHCQVDDFLTKLRRRRAGLDDDPAYLAALAARDAIVADIVRLGGTAESHEFRSSLPIWKASFAGTLVADADLELLDRLPEVAQDTAALGRRFSRAQTPPAPALTWLDLSSTAITDDGLQRLERLAALNVLSLQQTAVGDAGLSHLAGLEKLGSLTLASTRVTDVGLAHLAGCRELWHLNLNYVGVTDAGMERLASLGKLHSLFLDSTQVGDAGLERLAAVPSLAMLSLYGTPVTDAGLAHFAGRKGMQTLNLSGTAVSDAGLVHLAEMPDLQVLSLNETAVSDAGLAHLKRLTKLRQLELRGTQVTAQGIADMQRAFPQAFIGR